MNFSASYKRYILGRKFGTENEVGDLVKSEFGLENMCPNVCFGRDCACHQGVRDYLILFFGIDQVAESPAPAGDQAPAAPDVFAPQWIGEHDPNNNNGWIEWDVPLEGEVDEPMVDPEFDEEEMDDDDDWDDDVGGPSTAAVEGPSFPLPASGFPVPPTVIEDLRTHLGNLEYRHGVLMRKMEEVSDAEVVSGIKEIKTRVQQVESRVDTYPSGQMAVPGQDVIVGLSQQVQTLQTALHGAELQNQQLQTKVAEMESDGGILMSYMLWMEERLTVLEK
nr:hypothetical protein [Tanacetum cinerariifolium]